MIKICLYGPASSAQRLQSLQMTMALQGLASLTILEETLPASQVHDFAKHNACTGLILVDPALENLKKNRVIRQLAIYSPTYGRALSKNLISQHEEFDIPALWERIPSRIAENPLAGSILLPPIPIIKPTHANPLGASRGPLPHIATMHKLLDMEEARALQREYMSVSPRRTELVLCSTPTTLEELHAKVETTDLWYLPSVNETSCPWSLEMSTILSLGGRVVAVAPPNALKDIIPQVSSIDAAETIMFKEQFTSPDEQVITGRLVDVCMDQLSKTNIFTSFNQ